MRNQKGQSLISVLVSMGITSLLMMLIADLNLIMIRSNTTALANADILGYTNQIRSNMVSPDLVTRMLTGNNITGPIVINDPLIAGSTLSEAGYKIQPNDPWSVQSVVFENVIPVSTEISRLTLVINITKDPTRIWGGNMNRRVIGDVYCSLAGTTITTCGVIPPVAGPIVPPGPVLTDPSFTYNVQSGCSSVGGIMSDGVCSIHSGGGN